MPYDPHEDLAEVVGRGLRQIANSITPVDAMPGRDPDGNYIGSLTEAMMSLGGAFREVAGAIADLAEAVREGNAEGDSD